MALFPAICYCLHNLFHPVGRFVLRFVIGSHLKFSNYPNRDKLNASHNQQNTQQKEWFPPNVVAKEFYYEKIKVD
jgi:hypothetical protein